MQAFTMGRSVQVQPADTTLLIMLHEAVFPVLIWRGDDGQKCVVLSNNRQWSLGSPPCAKTAEEIFVLLPSFPPSVTHSG